MRVVSAAEERKEGTDQQLDERRISTFLRFAKTLNRDPLSTFKPMSGYRAHTSVETILIGTRDP
jgi:hypothetical protein